MALSTVVKKTNVRNTLRANARDACVRMARNALTCLRNDLLLIKLFTPAIPPLLLIVFVSKGVQMKKKKGG